MKRALKWILPILLAVLLLAYGGVSYLMASGVTSAERKELEDHPSNYGLIYESVEFQSRRGDITLEVNGTVQNSGTNSFVTSGPIGLQSEGAPIEFRNIYIESL